jgi:hypothetical protein
MTIKTSDIEEDVVITEYIALFDKFLAFPNIEIQERASLAVQTLKLASTNLLLKSIYELHDGKIDPFINSLLT